MHAVSKLQNAGVQQTRNSSSTLRRYALDAEPNLMVGVQHDFMIDSWHRFVLSEHCQRHVLYLVLIGGSGLCEVRVS